MIHERSYQTFFFIAIFFHLSLAIFLLWDHTSERAVMTFEAKNEAAPVATPGPAPEQQAIQAVTVDSHEVMEAMNQLKAERAQAAKVEANRQKALAMQAESARRQRIEEQQRVARLKEEAAKLAIIQKKKLEEEKQRMQQLAKQQEIQKKELQALEEKQREVKKQREQEEKTLSALHNKKIEDELKAAQAKAAAAQAQAQAEALEKQQQAQAMRASEDAAKRARVAGVVDRYKALITHAISQQWILPDRVDNRLSSQFRIRLAPNGTVLEVSLIRSSGDPILDRSAQSAIYKASPLPVPTDPDMFNLFRDISLTVRPENAAG